MSETEIVCPKCGSNQLSADKKGFSVGNALKGVAVGLRNSRRCSLGIKGQGQNNHNSLKMRQTV